MFLIRPHCSVWYGMSLVAKFRCVYYLTSPLPTAGQFVLVVVGVALVCILGVAGLGYCLHPPPGGRGACLGAR